MSRLIFRKVSSIEPAVGYLSKAINEHLENRQKVLWLVPGGSNIKIAAEISRRLLYVFGRPSEKVPKSLKDAPLKNLTVALTDERYGPVSHPDSNWLQLKEAGFSLSGATLIPVLDGSDLDTTVVRYNNVITDTLKNVDYKVGLFGIGADGHIAGIKPKSPAVDSKEMVVGYKWDDYIRITITPKAMVRLDEAIIYMIGEEKQHVIKQLAEKKLSIEQQPAQILKQIKKATIYNDYVGEEI